MRIQLADDAAPIYRQIVNYFVSQIESGVWQAGLQLPTVRTLAAENGMAQGTVKHAYDMLEQLGYIEKTQGRGTFVAVPALGGPQSKKERAMDAIDTFLDAMDAMAFTPDETRIFLDLKLRERESSLQNVRVGAVDCCPEALSAMCRQLSELQHIDVYEYLLPAILQRATPFDEKLDILVTTPTHFDDVAAKIQGDTHLIRLVMAVSRETLLALARIPADYHVGILSGTLRFADIIATSCEKYGVLGHPPIVGLFGDADAMENVLQNSDQVILPPNYHRFASPEEQAQIQAAHFKAPPLPYEYMVEKGSLLFLEEQANELYIAKQPK